MIFELAFAISGALASFRALQKPRPLYGLTVGWWKGAFTPDNSSSAIAHMIDSDTTCEWWEYQSRSQFNDHFYSRKFYSKHLKTTVLVSSDYHEGKLGGCMCKLYVEKKEGGFICVPVSRYDDYLLTRAIDRWADRKKVIDEKKKQRESEDLVNQRVTEGYIKQVEMIEKKILGKKESNTANDLTKLLEPINKTKEPGYVKGKTGVTSAGYVVAGLSAESTGTTHASANSSRRKTKSSK